MIYPLLDLLRGNTHVRITMVRRAPNSGVVVHYQPGTVDTLTGDFIPDRLIPEVRRSLTKPEADAVRERAAAAGAPVTAGEQEYRMADLLAHLDAEGWEPGV